MKLKLVLRSILYYIDILLFLASPMFVILLIVCVIAFVDRYNNHNNFVHRLEAYGQIAQVQLDPDPSPELGYHVDFIQDNGERFYGFLNPKYYPPEVASKLNPGEQVSIIYLPPPYNYDTDVVLANQFAAVQNYYGYATDIGLVFVVCWLVVAFHPEWLYIGFTQDFGDILKRTMAQPAPWQSREHA